MRTITKDELKIILENHRLWLSDSSKGKRADLSSANLSSADLSSTDLRFADLRYANLCSANLSYANLSSANLDKKYVSITYIGSRKGMTTFCVEENKIWCGCWIGTLEKFEKRVKATHKNNPQFLKEYLGAIKYFKSFRNQKKKEKGRSYERKR